MGGADRHSVISCGESSAVSIQRRHAPARPCVGGRSNSSGSQYALRIRCRNNASFFSSVENATAWEESPQSGRSGGPQRSGAERL